MEISKKYLNKYMALLRFPNLIGSKGIHKILSTNREDLRLVIEDGTPYYAVSVFAPTLLLKALGVHFLPLEPVIATAGQFGLARDFREVTQKIIGFDTSCCGGQSILHLFENEIIPLPKCILACSHMCDDSLKTFNFVAEYYNIPILSLDVPYQVDQAAVDYVATQLKEMANTICEMEGIRFGIDRLKEAVATANRTNAHRHEVFSLCKDNPPVFNMPGYLPAYPFFSKFGDHEAEEIYRTLAADIRKRVKLKKWVFQGDYFRILWMGMIPLMVPHFLSYLDTLKFGFPTTELMFHSDFETMDEQDPFKGMAQQITRYPLVGRTKRRLDKIDEIIKEYHIEAVIHFNHRGCLSFNGDNYLLSDHLRAEDIPFLVLEGDIGDNAYCSENQLKEKALNFKQILEARYGTR